MNNGKSTEVTDSRFRTIRNEAITVAVLLLLMIVIFMVIAATLGAGNPTEYTYLFGFPLWFTICFFIELVFIAIFSWLLLKKFTDISLDADDPAYNYEEEGNK